MYGQILFKNYELKDYLQLSVKLSARVCEIWPIVPSDNVKSSLKLSLKVPHNPTKHSLLSE